MNKADPSKVAVAGLGYVGLSLAVALGREIPTIGFDVNAQRIEQLKAGCDINNETSPEELKAPQLSLTSNPAALAEADFIIVAVPTPVDDAKRPDLRILAEASEMVGKALARIKKDRGDQLEDPLPIVVFESTVYPGCTEEVCVPALERSSRLKAGKDFCVGYSPERINPGDREHNLAGVVKIVSGMDERTTDIIARVYGRVVTAGIHRAPDIRSAEAAKVIENIQRDLNIALMNELSMLFDKLGLDKKAVLEAAETKWNFLPFKPGLVGGHCIPVDPYYLTYKAQEIGYHPEIILAGRRINDSMSKYLAHQAVRLLAEAGKAIKASKLLILGVTFKEDTRDLRNSRVMDTIRELESYGVEVSAHDPIVGHQGVQELGLRSVTDPFSPDLASAAGFDAVMIAVPHREFRQKTLDDYMRLMHKEGGPCILLDVKGIVRETEQNATDLIYWSL